MKLHEYSLWKKICIQVLILCFCLPLAVWGAEPQTVRVGYFRVGNYYKVDENGKIESYDTRWLDEISHYANLRLEYVDCGTWLQGTEMLNTGEIDLLGLALWSEEREKAYEFCLNSYGYNVSEIVTKPDSKIVFQDFEAIGKMKIGVRFNYVPKKHLEKRLQEQGQQPEIVVFRTQRELLDALKNGTVDAIATSSHLVPSSLKVIDKFEYIPIYFMAKKGNLALAEKIDSAIAEIHINNPSFDDNLSKEYFPSLNQYPLSKEEQEYINSLDSLTFCFCTNEGYLCRTENGQYEGIHPAIAKRICELLGVKYKEVHVDFPNLLARLAEVKGNENIGKQLVADIKSKGIDVWGDFFYDQQWANTLGVGITTPYLSSNYYEIRGKGDVVDNNTAKIALVRGLRFTKDIAQQYSPERIVWCDDFESCIKAVKTGKADATVVNTYAAEYYLAMFQYSDLSASLMPFSNRTALAVVDKNRALLLSALNKKLLSLSIEDKYKLVQQETVKRPKQNMLEAYVYTHTAETVAVCVVLLSGVILLGVLIFVVKRSRQQNEILQRAANAKSDFLAKMSHDMRTPMNAIINLTNMIEEEIDNKEAVKADLKKIKTSNEFLMSLINDILDVARIEQGKMTLNRQAYSDVDFINYMHTTFDNLCAQKDIAFTIINGKYNVQVIVDRVRFNQLCFNLVSNAIKYTPTGGTVTLRMVYGQVQDGRLPTDIYVADNGIGMSEEFVQQAFGQFEQENRQYMAVEGAGLGLTIVKEIVNLMGGTIEIKSKIDHGTTVHVHLPLEVAVIGNRTEAIPEQVEDLTSLQGKRVLVVEDHEINRQIAVRLLERKGMVVETAINGAEGVAKFTAHPECFDIILMDIRMPIMNGLEATKAIRALSCPEAKQVIILAMTANAYQSDIDASLLAGMDGHLAKPLVPKLMFAAMAKMLKK